LTCANPLATLAVIDPDWPVDRSSILVTRPAGESWMDSSSRSPARMNRSLAGSGVNAASVRSSGAGGACGRPLRVMKAKLAGSMLTFSRQSALLSTNVFWLRLKLKIATDAHHCVAAQLVPMMNGVQPGG
jgi:hypothetical protein